MHNRIAFSGKFQSGKSTIAKYISNKYGHTILSFAEDVRFNAKAYFKQETKDRRIYQGIGSFARSIDPDIWIKKLQATLVFKLSQGNNAFVIDDLRHKNEFVFLKNLDFVLVRINTPAHILETRPLYDKEFSNHESETNLDDWTHLFHIIIDESEIKNIFDDKDIFNNYVENKLNKYII